MRRILLVPMLLCTLVSTGAAQSSYFGQNKVQYKAFDWQVLRGPRVDVYHYPEEDEIARLTLAYAEESVDTLAARFGHVPRARIPIVVYASHTHFEQTNLLPFVPPEGILGFTEFMKRRVVLPFRGNYSEFRYTIRHELVHAFHLSIMSELSARQAGRPLARMPLWFTEGLAEYWSAGEDGRDHMVLRELVIRGRVPSLSRLEYVAGGVVYPLGGAIHAWMAEAFGGWRVAQLYREFSKYASFAEAMEAIYGHSLGQLDAQLQHYFRQRYFPVVAERAPIGLGTTSLTDLAIKPVAWRNPRDSALEVLVLTPRSGFMSIEGVSWDHPGQRRTIVKGERSAEFESFHPFASRIDVRDGVAVFTSKYLDRDALVFWDLTRQRIRGRYQFDELVSILSPAWHPDGRSVVFSGLSTAGFSDLYLLHLDDGRLEQLTRDRFEDLDPSFSPDGGAIVFASDRTLHGPDGSRNLFVLDRATDSIRYLTYGPWQDETPRWASNGRIYFGSDRDGLFDIFSVSDDGRGRRETQSLGGAFDPQWIPEEEELLYAAFDELSFRIVRGPAAGVDDTFSLEAPPQHGWVWSELIDATVARTPASPYDRRFSLDFAAGDALVAPGVGFGQGAVLLFSDLLSDHILFVTLTAFQGRDIGGFLDNLNGSVFYLNQQRRLNWGVGVYRLAGLFYESSFETLFEERSLGGFAEVRWPFSRFSRVEAAFRLERSDRFDILGGDVDEPRRVGLLATNAMAFVHDNTLWLPTGPVDGARRNLTLEVSNDLSSGRFDAWTVSLDQRRYVRLGSESAYALRLYGVWSDGRRPRTVNVGGSWGLRGYPRFGPIAGHRAFLINQEIRIPLSTFLAIGLPIGELRFPGVQGAIFTDVGGAWTDRSVARGVLGSAGFGFRMPLFYPLVLRLDVGWKFAFGETQGYAIVDPAVRRQFVDFFIGFNY